MKRNPSRDISTQSSDRIDTDSISEDGRDGNNPRFWPILPNPLKKGKMWSAKALHILPFIIVVAHHLRLNTEALVIEEAHHLAMVSLRAVPVQPILFITILGTVVVGSITQINIDDFSKNEDDPDARDSEQQDRDESEQQAAGDDDEETGVIYARVSSTAQAEEGESIDGQIDELESIAEEKGITLLSDSPIKDEGKTGTNFDRAGIQEVFRLAHETSLSYVLVDSVDRLGRAAAQTLYFIYVLQEDCQVTLITSTGQLNINQVEDLMQVYLTTLMSELETKGRARSALRSRARGFLDEKKWTSWYRQVPLGYEKDGDWIEKRDRPTRAAKEMFDHFLEHESYSKTAEMLNDEYWGILDSKVTWGQVKRYLQKPVYVGQPTIPIENIHNYRGENFVDDPDLQIVEEEDFAETQEIIEQIGTKSVTDEDTKELDDFIEEFGLFPVAETSPMVKLVCPDCGEEVRQNGQRNMSGDWNRHVYECTNENCGRQPTWPMEVEYSTWMLLNDEDYQQFLPQETEHGGWSSLAR